MLKIGMTAETVPNPKVRRKSFTGCGRPPVTTYLVEVISGRPIGPRACSFWVEMPISAPKPNSPPSVKRVEALTSTAAESTARDEALRVRLGVGDDRLGVRRGVAADVLDRRVERGYDGRGDLEREVLGGPVLLGRGLDPVLGGERLVAVDGDPGVLQGRTMRGTNSPATSACTSSDSAALHTEVRWVLALSTMRSAMSRSAAAST